MHCRIECRTLHAEASGFFADLGASGDTLEPTAPGGSDQPPPGVSAHLDLGGTRLPSKPSRRARVAPSELVQTGSRVRAERRLPMLRAGAKPREPRRR